MRQLKIKNFGPISSLDLKFDEKIQIVIGQQASGKSTIAKTIYFCRKVRDYVLEYIADQRNFLKHNAPLYQQFVFYIRRKFMGCFGTTRHRQHFEIEYYYDVETGAKISISLDSQGFARIQFSDDIKASILELLNRANDLFRELANQKNFTDIFDVLKNEIKRIQEITEKFFRQEVNKVFFDDEDIIYIPAGRSILSIYSDQLVNLDVSAMDLPMQEFIERILKTRNQFSCKMEEYVLNYTKTVRGQINNANVNLSIDIANKILKGNYVCDKDGEKIFYDKNNWVKLMYASSGQQESLWLLMLMFSYIVENKRAFIVLEEPEAHLFPEAQRKIVELIALFSNSTRSEVFLTTHSPYILTSFNLLIQSYIVENSKRYPKESLIIEKPLRVSPKGVNAYIIDLAKGLQSIMDKETGLINAFIIDEISDVINDAMEKLVEREIKYDL